MDSKLRSLMGKNNSLINLEASINIDKIIENREIMDNTEEQIINWDSEVSALQIRKVFRDKICKNEKLKVKNEELKKRQSLRRLRLRRSFRVLNTGGSALRISSSMMRLPPSTASGPSAG